MKKQDKEYVRLVQQEALILDVTELLVEVMEQLGVSRKELAERLNCTAGYVSQLLGGGKNLTLRTISDMAFALDLKPTFLLTRGDSIGVPAGRVAECLPGNSQRELHTG